MAAYVMRDDLYGDALALDADAGLDAARRRPHLHKPSALEVVPLFFRQAWAEARVRAYRHIAFRSRENAKARDAYAAMETWEFEGINARQAWANWRTIPKNLAGVADAPLRALDLCCGTGHSTAVLAFYLPPGSRILGFDYSPRFVELARSRAYLDRDGREADVRFRAQSVLETFRGTNGDPLADESVDLVNSSGAVGCHFDPASTEALANEVARVVRPGGLALIDSGWSGTSSRDVRALCEARGFTERHAARSCFVDPYLQICFRKGPRPTR